MCTTNNKNRKTSYLIKIVTLLLGLFLNSNYLKSQCSGSFYKVDGENFGTGVTMFTSALPPGTTTYTYRGGGSFFGCIMNMDFARVPDSCYTIAKNPANCLPSNCSSSFTSAWINTGDHTTGTGYMMITNARGFPDIFYNKVYKVAPNSTINFSVWVANICKLSSRCIEPRIKILFIHPTSNIVLDSINSPLLSSVSDSTLNWIKIGKSFIVPAGLSNIKLEVRNMQVGNSGNDIAIDDIEFSICMPTITIIDTLVNVCETKNFSINPTIPNNNLNDITYLWQYKSDTNGVWTSLTSDTNKLFLRNNVSNTNTGFYRLLIAERGNIDSPYYRAYSIPVRVNVIDTNIRYLYDTICSNGMRVFNGQNITTSGIFRDTLANAQGCDSFVILNLFVKPTSTGLLHVSICSNTTYFFNGQMLSTTGIYRDTLKNMQGCDSFLTLNLTVKNITSKTIHDTICSNGMRVFNGQNITTSGIFRDTLVNAQGCDSFVILNLFVKPTSTGLLHVSICSNTTYFFNGQMLSTAGIYRDTLKNMRGCDSFLTLNLTVKNITSKTIYDTICSNGMRVFNGQNITTSGIFRDTLANAQGCDSFVILNLFVKPTSTGLLHVSICSNTTYFFNGQMLSTTGIYRDTLKNMQDCDSFLTLNLTVKNITSKTIHDTICSNGMRVFNGQNITTSGIFRDTLVNAQGCDSFVILNLFVKPTSTGLLHVSICSNTTYFFNGQMLSTAGIFRDTLKNMQGCDSFLILNLTLKNITSKTIHDTICSNGMRVFNGQNITTSGIFRDTLVNTQGCDSFVILNLFVKPTSTGLLHVSICSNTTYFFNGQMLSTAGIYRDTLKNIQGCDSFLTLNLTLKNITSKTIHDTICSNGLRIFNGQNITTSGIFRDTLVNAQGCDSFVILNLFVKPTSTGLLHVSICSNTTYFFNGQMLSTTGIYRDTLKNMRGCDSFLTLNLTVKPQITYYIDTIISKGQLLNSKGRLLDTSGTYIDTLINSYGCDSIVFYSVIVEDTSNSKNEIEIETFIIPNYISPNGDFINDFWVLPRNIYKKHPNLKSIIYNRWGNIVWRSTGKYNDDWNGQLQDSQELVPDGVYYYILELEENMKVTCSGFIQVLR